MRYRRSREIRQKQEVIPRSKDHRLRNLLIGMSLCTVVGWGGWALIFSPRGVAGLLTRPEATDQTVDNRTVEYKNAQACYLANDYAIARAMTNLQILPNQVKENQSWTSSSDGAWIPTLRTLRVSSFYSVTQCNLEFTRSITATGGTVVRADESRRSDELVLQIAYDNRVTHELTIVRDGSIQRKVGHMAIIINGLGSQTKLVDQFLNVNIPLTFALNPWQSGTTKLMAEINQYNQEVLVHLPMEPKSYPRVSPGKKAVMINQTEEQNRKVVRDGLRALSLAHGVTNFMGSRVTENKKIMSVVLDELKQHDKYFVDSRTSTQSIAYTLGHQIGVQSASSWGFIDAVDNQARISTALDLASYAALEQGPVIVIAHARSNTLAALLQKLSRMALRGIQFVHVSSLISRQHTQLIMD